MDLGVGVVLLAWIPVILMFFCVMTPRHAVMVSFLVAWLFLPVTGIKFAAGIPLYDKMTATCAGVLLATVCFDMNRLFRFRSCILDLPMALWCACPLMSSIANDLGVYDGVAAAFSQTVTWGIPYFIGRVYFRELSHMRDLAIALFMGGLIYVPLCLIEIRMSPQLHNWVYGFQPYSFVQTIRFGGWRPTVFMSHGLMVGMWMCMTSLIGGGLWYCGLKHARGFPVILAVVVLSGTAVLCKSTGAIVLLVLGAVSLFAAQRAGGRTMIFALIMIAPLYMATRGSGLWSGNALRNAATTIVGDERADSLAFRMKNEDLLAAHAREHPFFGWGGWGRNRVYDAHHYDLAVTDGLWILNFGINGLIGLAAWTLALLLPPAFVLMRFDVKDWRDPLVGPAIVISVAVILYLLDGIPNAMSNPIFTLCAGGLASMACTPPIATFEVAWWGPNSELPLSSPISEAVG